MKGERRKRTGYLYNTEKRRTGTVSNDNCVVDLLILSHISYLGFTFPAGHTTPLSNVFLCSAETITGKHKFYELLADPPLAAYIFTSPLLAVTAKLLQ